MSRNVPVVPIFRRYRSSVPLVIGLAVASLLGTRTARAQGSASPGRHEHDGFYLRVLTGLGYTHISGGDLTVKGRSGMFGLALGYNVADDLVVFAEVFDDVIVGPTVELEGVETEFDDDVGVYVLGWGAGLAYYFMPADAYTSVTLAASRLVLDTPDDDIRSSWGLGANAVVGKEWWVSDNWGLGLAAYVYAGGIPDGGETFKTVAGALAFTATYD